MSDTGLRRRLHSLGSLCVCLSPGREFVWRRRVVRHAKRSYTTISQIAHRWPRQLELQPVLLSPARGSKAITLQWCSFYWHSLGSYGLSNERKRQDERQKRHPFVERAPDSHRQVRAGRTKLKYPSQERGGQVRSWQQPPLQPYALSLTHTHQGRTCRDQETLAPSPSPSPQEVSCPPRLG